MVKGQNQEKEILGCVTSANICQTFSNIGVLAGRKHKKRLGSEALTRLLGSYSDHVTGFQGQVTGRKAEMG